MGRIRTVEHDPPWGWIARDPFDGKEFIEDGFRWRSRSVARAVVDEQRAIAKMKEREKAKKRRKP